MDIPSGFLNKIKKLPELSKMTESFPKLETSGPVTEITSSTASFGDIPILKSWPDDAGRFITLGLVATSHPETKVRNLGVFRIQIIDNTHALMHWQKHKRGAHHSDISKDKGEKIPTAIIIGGEPATVFSSIAPVPEGLDKFLFACTSARRIRQILVCRNYKKERNQNGQMQNN
jgi:4-hydroxy-3-polyprenylbenzoate decarboxylase